MSEILPVIVSSATAAVTAVPVTLLTQGVLEKCSSSIKKFFSKGPVEEAVEKTHSLIDICKATSEVLQKRGIHDPNLCREMSAKMGYVFIPPASLETDPDLQKLWAKLLANALDPNFEESKIRMAFIDIIKSLEPLEARLLQYCSQNNKREFEHSDFLMAPENSEINEESLIISLENLKRLRIIKGINKTEPLVMDMISLDVEESESFRLTPLGLAFLEACAI
jgi:hypothetical protein